MKRIFTCGVVLSMGVLLGGCQTSTHEPKLAIPTVDGDLHGAGAEWDRRFNAGDSAGLSELYAKDMVSMPPGAPTVLGRDAMRRDFQTFMSANTARHETKTDQILREGDLAIERAHYVLTYKPKAGGAEVSETGRHVEVRKKFDDQWQIIWEIWNTDTAK